MHPYLTRLGVRPEVQVFFGPYFQSGKQGHLVFNYGDAAEHFGLAFHRIPVSENCWQAGCRGFNRVSLVVICSSAMEAIAFYDFKYSVYTMPDSLLFIAVGTRPIATNSGGLTKTWREKNIFLFLERSCSTRLGN